MTAPGRRTLIGVGVAVYLLVVILSFPAELAVRWFVPDGVVVSVPSGTLWNGRATAIAVAGTVTGETRWQVRPLALLRGRLSADVSVDLAGGAVAGRVSLSPGGTLYLQNVAGVVPLAMLDRIIPTSTFDGRLGLDLSSAKLIDNWLVDANGTVDLVDLRIVAPIEKTLGNYELAFAGADGELLAGTFRDVQASLTAQGVLNLHHDRRWEMDGLVSAAAGTPGELTRALAMLGQRDPQGRYRLTLSGEM